MIIGFTGLKGSGKDTAGAYLVKEYDFERRSFADPLKRSIAALLDIPLWEIENFKNNETVYVTTGYKNRPTDDPEVDEYGDTWIAGVDYPESLIPKNLWSPIREHTFREILQRYGTESHRDIFGKDFWVNATLPVEGFYSGRKIVVTDVRFMNEYERIKQLKGYVVRIAKTRAIPEIEQDHHSSETEQTGMPYDFWIENLGTYDQFYREIEMMLEKVMPYHDE
jgi:hypothetical protein